MNSPKSVFVRTKMKKRSIMTLLPFLILSIGLNLILTGGHILNNENFSPRVRNSPKYIADQSNSISILILYGSQEDYLISRWLSSNLTATAQHHKLTDISSLLKNDGIDWDKLKAIWIINSNISLTWDYYYGTLLSKIISEDINIFLMTPSFEWIDPYYWGIFGIERYAWFSSQISNVSKLSTYQLTISNPQLPTSLMQHLPKNVSLSLNQYASTNITTTGKAGWVNIKKTENIQKIISIQPMTNSNQQIMTMNDSSWESGTFMKINDKNAIFTTTFFPTFQHSAIPLENVKSSTQKHQLNPLMNPLRISSVTSDNETMTDDDIWNILKTITNWTTLLSFSLISKIALPPPNEFFPATDFVVISIIASFIFISFAFILAKLGILRRFTETIISLIITTIFAIGSITYSPYKRRLSEDDLLQNEVRRKIVEYLEAKGSSGAHLREIQSHVNKSISSVLWHLQTLKEFGLIDSKKVGKYKIYYLTRPGDRREEVKKIEHLKVMEWSTLLKSKHARDIAKLLLNSSKPLKLSIIARKVKCHHETARYHLLRMLETGMISCNIHGDNKRAAYYLDPEQRNQISKLLFKDEW